MYSKLVVSIPGPHCSNSPIELGIRIFILKLFNRSFQSATGHFSYTKSAYLYLHFMVNLKSTNKNIPETFQVGKFVVWPTSKYWAGLPFDLVIQQVLMRSLKSTRRLARGAGISNVTRFIYGYFQTQFAPVIRQCWKKI